MFKFRRSVREQAQDITRMSAIIIIAITLISGTTNWLERDTVSTLTLIMALFILVISYKEYLESHPKTKYWIMMGLAVFLALGVLMFVLQSM